MLSATLWGLLIFSCMFLKPQYILSNKLNKSISSNVNDIAENLVTKFEIEVIKDTEFMDGIIDTLKILKNNSNNLLGIVSNNAKEAIEFALDKDGLKDYFDVVVGRPNPFDPDKIKPNPEQILKALELLNLDKSDTNYRVHYVGDAVNDIFAAKNARISSIGVATGKYSMEELIKAGANICLKSFSEIIKYI